MSSKNVLKLIKDKQIDDSINLIRKYQHKFLTIKFQALLE